MRLFDAAAQNSSDAPLADRMRPRTIDEIEGQGETMGPGSFLREAIARDAVPSLILWGPPGSGKTTTARVVAASAKAVFEPFSAVLGGVKEVRAIVARARDRRRMEGRKTLLFVDEIHRFNKAQQDAFLPHVEDGTLTLIGATTENPSFALNAALISRCRVMVLVPLSTEALTRVIRRALADEERGLGGWDLEVDADVAEALAAASDGDARQALTALEQAAGHARRAGTALTVEGMTKALGEAVLRHDRTGDGHYDLTSAFIKSMRGSDPDATLYYLARLIAGGDDPRFLCRRLIIFAAEDIGNADPRALSVAVDGASAYDRVGMPEGRIILGQICTYLACAPKSNAAYLAINEALALAKSEGTLPVPTHLRNAPTALAKMLGHGEGYRYPHDHGGWVSDDYLPDVLVGTELYRPTEQGYERHLAERLRGWRKARDAAKGRGGSES